ncbi:MAG: DUF488 family protein [Succinivibrio sp.]|nr:DUF488 family protein [Succinivibrio sp.]
MGEIICQRVYLKPFPVGYRVLVDRLWPRGVNKETLQLDLWCKELAPSSELRKWFAHSEEKFAEFKVLYLKELEANEQSRDFLFCFKKVLARQNLILLYAARDEHVNHAVVLKSFLERKLKP